MEYIEAYRLRGIGQAEAIAAPNQQKVAQPCAAGLDAGETAFYSWPKPCFAFLEAIRARSQVDPGKSNPLRRWAGAAPLEPLSPAILKLDEERRANTKALQDMQARRNAASKEIGKAKGKGGDPAKAEALMAEVAELKDKITAGESAGARA